MKQDVFTIYDSKAHAYLTPFFLHNQDMAIRVFADCANNPEHQFGKHPEDYTLFKIGVFNDTKGRIDCGNPLSLGVGIEFLTAEYSEKQQDWIDNNPDEPIEKMYTDPPIGDLKEVK